MGATKETPTMDCLANYTDNALMSFSAIGSGKNRTLRSGPSLQTVTNYQFSAWQFEEDKDLGPAEAYRMSGKV
jgi:hypothetical protein